MLAPGLLAVAAVLCEREVAVVRTDPLTVVARSPLPAPGVALFAAPDARVVVPLEGSDGTAVVQADGSVRRWPGRIFPLFFDEVDRMYVVVPGLVMTLAYPERVEIERARVTGLGGVWRAACSRDGRLVAIVPAGGQRRELVLAEPRPGGIVTHVKLAETAELVAVAPDGAWVVVAGRGGELELVSPDGPGWHGKVGTAGAIEAFAVSADGRDLAVVLSVAGGGALAGMRIDPERDAPLRIKFVTVLANPPNGVAFAGDDVLVTTADGVVWLRRRGRKVAGSMALTGARAISVLPASPQSTVPAWSDRPGS
jgi:hypothetical protein